MTETDFYNTPGHFKTRLVRNRDMVHKRQCYRVSGVNVNPWEWAEGRPFADVARARQNGLKFCKSCDPLDEAVRIPPDASKGSTDE